MASVAYVHSGPWETKKTITTTAKEPEFGDGDDGDDYERIKLELYVCEEDLEETLRAIWAVRPTAQIVATDVSFYLP